jgi:dihydrofolate synthase / folylpolyglutamate synthase
MVKDRPLAIASPITGGDRPSSTAIDDTRFPLERQRFVTINSLLQRYERFGIHLGLERIQQLLANLGNPQRQVPVIHVAGTNGKGSVCAYLSAVLTEAGYRVGRYTSPHLVDWCERICLNEQPISEADLVAALQQVEQAIPADQPSPTQFEVITAAAWLYFAQQSVDIAVVEVGLGGRLDATNVCETPLVSIITSISRDHWQRLGSTLAAIASEKAGILKPSCPAVVGPLPPEAQAVVQQRLEALNCPALWPQPAQDLGNGQAASQGLIYTLPLPGAIQLTNSALAIAALQILRQQGWSISDQAIMTGIAKTRWPGRLQWTVWGEKALLIDGAHNPAAAQALRQFVDTLEAPCHHWVMGMLATKDHAEIFQALLRPGENLYLVPVPEHESAQPQALATLAQEICPQLNHCQAYPDWQAGLKAAMASPHLSREGTPSQPPAELGRQAPVTILCGSLYLIGQFLKQHQARL